MKRSSIRLKITLWFTAALIIVVLFAYLIVFAVSNQILQKTIRDNLIETVEHNVDEIEYLSELSENRIQENIDHFLEYKGGYLEVDDDFLDEVNQVYTGLYDSDIRLLYGENPISGYVADMSLSDSKVRKVKAEGEWYYVFDRKLSLKGMDGLWLRGVVSDSQGVRQMSGIIRFSLIALPILVILASTGGYFIAGRTLKPIHKISDTAKQIGKGNDLKKRIDIGEGSDELHELAQGFNDMFDRLESAFEQERQFTSDVSHELRTPMSVIKAQCEFSLERERSVQEYETALRVIQRQSRKMTKLINHMLDFARLEMRSEKYLRETVDLSALVAGVCSDMMLIREQGITLTYTTEDVKVRGNRELLTRLLTNLISNAYRYGNEGGHIRVTLKRQRAHIVLCVADDGIGISKEEQRKIFRRFYQADTSRSERGTGLGLAMASEIARFHGGTISVDSEPGEGSTFTVSLPDE